MDSGSRPEPMSNMTHAGYGRRSQRAIWVMLMLSAVSISIGCVLYALSYANAVSFFYSPADLLARSPDPNTRVRLGGLVESGSVERLGTSGMLHFRITDGEASILVRYVGVVPDLFAEGQAAIVEGFRTGDDLLIADKVMAKHDEFYMPADVAARMEERELRAPDGK